MTLPVPVLVRTPSTFEARLIILTKYQSPPGQACMIVCTSIMMDPCIHMDYSVRSNGISFSFVSRVTACAPCIETDHHDVRDNYEQYFLITYGPYVTYVFLALSWYLYATWSWEKGIYQILVSTYVVSCFGCNFNLLSHLQTCQRSREYQQA
jgi:hypothetical protein